jgi:hypothetical protein
MPWVNDERWKTAKTQKALLKRCLAFIEYQVDHYKRDGDRAYVDLDLGEASILLVDLQEVTR